MALFGSFGFGGGFDEDPFMQNRSHSLTRPTAPRARPGAHDFDSLDVFGASRNMFGQMDLMMNSMMRNPLGRDPFGRDTFYQESPFPAIMGGPHLRPQGVANPLAISPFGGFNLMTSMNDMGRGGSCQSYSSSSVMTMTTGPDGKPQVYQASSSSRSVPGGVRETKKTVSDSRSGLRKMAIGHHINDRSHVIERELKQGRDMEEREEFVNLDEEEAPQFNEEFRRVTQQNFGGPSAIEHRGSPSHFRSNNLPALPYSRSDERARVRERIRPRRH